MSIEKPVERVVDLIAELENVDPTVPVEIWLLDDEGNVRERCIATSILQMTPPRFQALGLADDRSDKGPFPTVIFTSRKCDV
jgi:hypothetical protein